MSRSKRRSHQATATKRPMMIGLAVFLGILLIAFGGYAYQANSYKDRFLPKTFIGEVDVSRQTVRQANEHLNQQFNDLSFTLLDEKNEWKSIKKTDFGLQTAFSKELEKWQKTQNPWTWGWQYFTKKQTFDLSQAAFDEEKLNERQAALQAELTAWNKERKQTQNATLTRKETGFEITPEVQGENIDIEAAMAAVKDALLAGKSSLELTTFVQKPSVTEKDPQLTEELKNIQRIAQVEGTYIINGHSFQIPSETINDWLLYQEGHIDLDREKVYQYVTQLGADYNTSTNPSSFNSTLRGEVSVPAGSLSWTISPDSETDGLIADILNGEAFTRSPIAQGSASSGSPLFGNTYIEIDMVNQHMWYYKDGKVALETDIVTGKPSTPTPPGVFYVWNKKLDEVLRGFNDDGSKYASPVKYWMPIDWTGVGIHDSDWQPHYGGELWKTVGSHGCINTPPGVMAQLYEMVEVGTPVLAF
ncbi:L,D-transpeptidase family protein [Enterococcus sp. LJL98]